MNQLYVVVLLVSLTWTFTFAYYPMVMEAMSGTEECPNKVDSFLITSGYGQIIANYKRREYNLCVVPRRGQTSGTTDIWGIATYEAARKIVRGELNTKAYISRELCEKLTGKLKLTLDENVTCDLYLISQDQDNPNVTQLSDIMPLAGIGECPMKAGTVVLPAYINDESCKIAGGQPTDYSAEIKREGYWCAFDLCYTEPYQCVPTDGWTSVQMCINDAKEDIKCVINFEEGLTTAKGRSSEAGGGTSLEVSAEVSSDFAGLFSASLSTTVGAEFSWSDTVSDEATWGETTTHTMEIVVPAGETIQVQQLVGACGDARVKTRNLRAVQSSNKKTRSLPTRSYK